MSEVLDDTVPVDGGVHVIALGAEHRGRELELRGVVEDVRAHPAALP